MREDGSNGYEGIADLYVAGRGTRPAVGDAIGAAVVRTWAQAFPPGAAVLDLGSGPGEPSTRILREAGLATCAVDASAAMVADALDGGGNHYYFAEKRSPTVA